jgi:glycyl-tRNA synthetase
MAHYACDCWDAEMLTSYGWIECVGIADRSCFDLSQHSMKSNETLVAYEQYKDGPRIVEVRHSPSNVPFARSTDVDSPRVAHHRLSRWR